MHCTKFYLCGVLYLNKGLKVLHTYKSGHTSSDSVIVLCEMCSALVGQDASRRRIGYSYRHSVHSCPQMQKKLKNHQSFNSHWTVIFLQSFGKSGEIPPLLNFHPVISNTTSLGSTPLSPVAWTGNCFRLEEYWVEGKGWGTGNL